MGGIQWLSVMFISRSINRIDHNEAEALDSHGLTNPEPVSKAVSSRQSLISNNSKSFQP